jgi:excisionase family DNA binding protein
MNPSNSTLLGDALVMAIREAVRAEIQAALGHNGNGHKGPDLLTPEQLADRLKVPLSWVYEQSRQGKIPTHRLGRYIRFDLAEVLASQKNK